MAKRKDTESGHSPTQPPKRSRQQLPSFRPIRPSLSHQRSTVLYSRQNGRLGQRRKLKDVSQDTNDRHEADHEGTFPEQPDESMPDDNVPDDNVDSGSGKTKRKRTNNMICFDTKALEISRKAPSAANVPPQK
ncbi:hypothetical protein H0H92_013250, partial [Tricholoma furcatifolium]